MNQRGKPVDAYYREQKEKFEGDSYRNNEDIHSDPVEDNSSSSKQKAVYRQMKRDQYVIYGVIGVVIIVIVLIFVFL